MKLQKVRHHNLIGHEIGISFSFGYPDSDREVFCKRLHKITAEPDCSGCPYLLSFEMGHGYECVWDDIPDGEFQERVIKHEDRQKEFERVSKLIEEGVLQKG